jgi:hypothetical protein
MTVFILASSGLLIVFWFLAHLVSGSNKKKVQAVIDKAMSLGGTQLLHINKVPIRYWLSHGNKHYPSVNNSGSIIVFEDFILVIRKQVFLITTWLKPMVISLENWNIVLGTSVESLIPKKFIYWEKRRMDVEIQLIDRQYNHVTSSLTLQHLTAEQIDQIKAFEKRIKPMNLSSSIN